ncbi:MAG: D-alanyl-D-alanine carboxypeptidase/D-alanyl-D-alanine endopeptidase [Planctomycetota bacterium]
MIHRASWTLSALAALLLTSFVAADLRTDIESAVRKAKVGPSIGISVVDVQSGRVLYESKQDELMIPASNMKLLTTGAALHVLGPEFRFSTKMVLDGDRLIVVGDGDPAFGDPKLLRLMAAGDKDGLDVEEFLDLWVNAVHDTGITSVSEVLVDDRVFDRAFVHSTWPIDQLNQHYCAEVAGLNFHANVLHFYLAPTSPGVHAADISNVHPRAPWLDAVNRTSSEQGPHAKSTAWIARVPNSNRMTVYGNVEQRYRTPVAVTVNDMPRFFAHLLYDRLRRGGVEVEHHGVVDLIAPDSEGEIIGPVITTPLTTIIARTNRDSMNLYAEAMLKRIGNEVSRQPGSWMNGGAILRHVLHERLRNPSVADRIVVRDGSGLSKMNRVAPSTMTAWIGSLVRDPELGEPYLESMAVAGEHGTMRRRFRSSQLHGATVRAKSGYINRVSCLSGVITGADGRHVAFSILCNGLSRPGSVRDAKKLQEDIVARVAEELAARSAITLGSD